MIVVHSPKSLDSIVINAAQAVIDEIGAEQQRESEYLCVISLTSTKTSKAFSVEKQKCHVLVVPVGHCDRLAPNPQSLGARSNRRSNFEPEPMFLSVKFEVWCPV